MRFPSAIGACGLCDSVADCLLCILAIRDVLFMELELEELLVVGNVLGVQ